MFIFKICVWIKRGNIFLAHPVYEVLHLDFRSATARGLGGQKLVITKFNT